MFGLVVANEVPDDVDESHGRMAFVALGFVQQGLDHRGHPCIVRLVPDRGDVGGGAEMFPGRQQMFHVDGGIHDFHSPLS